MEKINFREEYQMAFQDLENYLKPEVFSYLLTQLNKLNVDNSTGSDADKIISKLLKSRQEDTSPVESSESSSIISSLQSSSEPSILPNNLPEEVVKIKKQGGRRRGGSSESSSTLIPSLSSQSRQSHQSVSGVGADFSFGPNVSRKFPHQKGGTLDGRSKKSQSRSRNADEFKRNVTPYDSLVGKINQSEPGLFERGRKLPKPVPGVRQFSNPITNPLYKNYNPQGYTKNEDEVAREFVTEITNNFNDWLRSFEGDLKLQLDPELMIKILRDDMELAFHQ